MKVNIFFDNDECADVIIVPDNVENIEEIQLDFFKWLFDKKNNHKYWVYEDGEKKYCSYGVDAFVEWLNCTVLKNSVEKASIFKSHSNKYCKKDIELLF